MSEISVCDIMQFWGPIARGYGGVGKNYPGIAVSYVHANPVRGEVHAENVLVLAFFIWNDTKNTRLSRSSPNASLYTIKPSECCPPSR